MLAIVPPSIWPDYGLRLAIPFVVLLFLMAAPGAYGGRVPDIGIPAAFLAASLAGLVSGRRLNFLKVTQKAVEEAMPILAILAGVGMFIQVMTLTGARGWTVVSILSLPSFLLYLGIALSLPAFGGVSTFGSASILGIPFILALVSRNALLTSASLFGHRRPRGPRPAGRGLRPVRRPGRGRKKALRDPAPLPGSRAPAARGRHGRRSSWRRSSTS